MSQRVECHWDLINREPVVKEGRGLGVMDTRGPKHFNYIERTQILTVSVGLVFEPLAPGLDFIEKGEEIRRNCVIVVIQRLKMERLGR